MKSITQIIDFTYDMHLQNMSGREDFDEAFKEGIRVGVLEAVEEISKFHDLEIEP